MKRAFQEQINNSPQSKKLCNKPTSHQKTLFSNDVIGVICSFLSFDEIQDNCLQLVNHQWKDSLSYDFRFKLLDQLENYLSSQFKSDFEQEPNKQSESMKKLFVTVKQWLYSQQYLLETKHGKGRGKRAWAKWMIDMNNRNHNSHHNYPKLKITKMETFFFSMEQFQVLHIQLNEKSSMKLTIFYSPFEDTIIYVDVLSGVNDFKWEEWNIDPNIKRNTVLLINAKNFQDADCLVEEYQINQKFFDQFFNIVKFPLSLKKSTPFTAVQWAIRDDRREITNPRPIENVEFERDLEIHDERADFLINSFDLSIFNEVEVLKMAQKVACHAFTSIREQKYQNSERVSVSNVIGQILQINFYRKPRLCIDLTFNIKHKGMNAKAKLFYQQNFYYGHDGYESDLTFEIKPDLEIYNEDGDELEIFNTEEYNEDDDEDNEKDEKDEKDDEDNEKDENEDEKNHPDVDEIHRQLIDIAPYYNILGSDGCSLRGNEKALLKFFKLKN